MCELKLKKIIYSLICPCLDLFINLFFVASNQNCLASHSVHLRTQSVCSIRRSHAKLMPRCLAVMISPLCCVCSAVSSAADGEEAPQEAAGGAGGDGAGAA